MSTLADPDPSPVGILAGNGAFPGEVARAVVAGGGGVVIAGIEGEAGADLEAFGLTRVSFGQINKILMTFRNGGCQELVIVGGVTRPDLTRLKADMGLLWNLPELLGLIWSGGDDNLLRIVVRFFERKGFTVVSPVELAPNLVLGAGSLGQWTPTAEDAADMLLGSSIVKALGPFDIGQGVIVSGGRIEAIEAAEGTDRMLDRVAARRAFNSTEVGALAGVLVKRPKPSQEMRVDLPAIGPATATKAGRAGLKGIAVLAGQTLVTDRQELARRADAAGLFVYGFTDGDEMPRSPRPDGWQAAAITHLAGPRPGKMALADARFGAAALGRLTTHAPRGAVAVRRGHVLGLEPDGNTEVLFDRVGRLTQWGERRLGRRLGVAVLGPEAHVTATTLAQAAAGRIAGIALMGSLSPADISRILQAAAKGGLFLIQLTPQPRVNQPDPTGGR